MLQKIEKNLKFQATIELLKYYVLSYAILNKKPITR